MRLTCAELEDVVADVKRTPPWENIQPFKRPPMPPPTKIVRLHPPSAGAATAESSRADDVALKTGLQQLQVQAASFGTRFIVDASVREMYLREIAKMSQHVLEGVRQGEITPRQGAEFAHQMRNLILEQARLMNTDVGRASAEAMKAQAPSLEALIASKSTKLFGREASQLNATEMNQVYLAIVESSGRGRVAVTEAIPYLKAAGRTAIVLTVAVSVYNVATAEDKVEAGRHEVLGVAGGFVGGAAGGAVAGLVCGPGAPVCSTIGVFVGGVAGALGVDVLDGIVNPRSGHAPELSAASTQTQMPSPVPTPQPTPAPPSYPPPMSSAPPVPAPHPTPTPTGRGQ
jgi:hypothetical protein